MTDTVQPSGPKKPFYGWKNVFIMFFTYLGTTGLVFYALSVIFPAMLKEMGWNRGDASLALTASTLLGGFLIPVGVKLLNKYGAQKVITIGLVITAVNLLLLGTVVTELWQWILIWGLMIPFGRVMAHRIAIQTTIMYWFSQKRAMVIGIVMTGAAFGGFLAPPIYTWFMKLMGGWRFGWLLSFTVVVVALVLSFFLKNKPSDLGQYQDGLSPDEKKVQAKNSGSAKGTYRSETEWTLKEALRTRTLWFITGANITQVLTLNLIINHGVLHLTDVHFSSMQAAKILSVIILSSGFVRFPLGWLGDRIEPRWIIFTALIFMLIGFLGLWKAPSYGILMAVAPIYGIGYGAIITILPTIMGNYYGPEVFANINAFFAPIITVINAIIPTAAGYVVESFGSYDGMFIVLGALLSCGVVLSAFLSPPQKKAVV